MVKGFRLDFKFLDGNFINVKNKNLIFDNLYLREFEKFSFVWNNASVQCREKHIKGQLLYF